MYCPKSIGRLIQKVALTSQEFVIATGEWRRRLCEEVEPLLAYATCRAVSIALRSGVKPGTLVEQ